MKAYGYEVNGSPEALADVSRTLKDEKSSINWENFNTGNLYWDDYGYGYKVEIDHESKEVTLNEW